MKLLCLLDFVHFNGFEQRNTVRNCCGNILDLALVTSVVDISLAKAPLSRVDNYHQPFIVSFFFPLATRIFHSQSWFSYSNGDYYSLYQYLRDYDWSSVLADQCVESSTSTLSTIVQESMQLFIPKRVSHKSNYPSWFSKELRHCLRRKLHYHRLYKKTGNVDWYTRFSQCRAQAKRLFKQDKQQHADIAEKSLSTQPQCMWKFVKESIKENVTTITLRDNEDCVSDPVDVANIFARHFSASFSKNNGLMPSSNINCMDFLTVAPINESEVLEAIKKLKPKLSTGVDGIPSFIVKGCAPLLCPVLVHIFNLSLASETFPAAWKRSVVVPLHKSGDRSMVNNYRPVSLLCSLSKVYEIVLHTRLYAYFCRKIIPEQHGFMKGRSTETYPVFLPASDSTFCP